jgi:membrane associated rhomboid family serine protease
MVNLIFLERKVGKYIPQNLTIILLVGQVLSYVLTFTNPQYFQYFPLSGKQLINGELWRIITFAIAPVSESLIFVIFAWYFFYMFGTALENKWGSFRYLVYIALSYILTIIFALIFPEAIVTNTYLYASLFLAFVQIYPNFQLLLFFIIPVKVKWLGYLTWFGLISTFLVGELTLKVLIVLSVSNFILFFWKDLFYSLKVIKKGGSKNLKNVFHEGKPLHICAICAKNEVTNPDMEIRYCSQCFPTSCYCGEHIKNHQHKRAVN